MTLPSNLNRFGGGHRRPYYSEVEYVENPVTATNVSYFLTNIKPSVGTSITMELTPTDISTRRVSGASGTQGDGEGGTFFEVTATGYWGGGGAGTVEANTTTVQKVKISFDTDYNYIYVDDVLAFTLHLSIPHTQDPYFWGLGAVTGQTGVRMPAKWYRCYQQDEDGNLMHDIIPVLDWNMTPCMYDRITNTLIYKTQLVSSGTIPQLNYGREIHYVDYLESSGTEYINTGYYPNFNTETKSTFTVKEASASQCSDFVRWSASPNYDTFGTYIPVDGTSCNVYYGRFSSNKLYTKNFDFVNNEVTIEVNKNSIVFNGTATTVTRGAEEWTNTSYPLYLFAGNNVGTTQFQSKIQLKLYQVSENGVLFRDYKPAVDEYGVGFMFDKVEHKIYDNAGTGAFKYPDVTLEYLKSNGPEYIDTAFYPDQDTKVSMKFDYDAVTAQVLSGSRIATYNNQYVIFLRTGTGGLRFDYGSDIKDVQTPLSLGSHEIVKDKAQNYLDGELVETNTAQTFTCVNSLYIFGNNNNGTFSPNTGADTKLKEYNIWDNGTLVRAYKPILRNGSAGLLDTANNVFYGNDGSGTFNFKIKETK